MKSGAQFGCSQSQHMWLTCFAKQDPNFYWQGHNRSPALCNLDFLWQYQSSWTCGILLPLMIGPVVCSQRPSRHQFMTRQPQSSHQSNRHTTHSTEQMCQCQNQSRQASHPPLIKLASHLSRSENWPRYGKWNDRAFTLLVAEGPGGVELFAANSFYPKKVPERAFWNI